MADMCMSSLARSANVSNTSIHTSIVHQRLVILLCITKKLKSDLTKRSTTKGRSLPKKLPHLVISYDKLLMKHF